MKNLDFIGFPMYAVTPQGRVFSLFTRKFLSDSNLTNGYCQVTLQEYDVRETWLVHRLVAMAFIPNSAPDVKIWVNHKNGRKTDNSAANLEWVTPKENAEHAILTGLRKAFKRSYRPISDDLVHAACRLMQDGWRNCDIAKATGLGIGVIAKIRYGTHYPDISKLYDLANIPSSRRKLSDSKVIKICEMMQAGEKFSKIMRELQVGYSTLKSIKDQESYTHLSAQFQL